MFKDQARQEISRLTAMINLHNHNYYVLNSPTVSDQEFDALMKSLESLEKEFPELADPLSPTKRVGSDLTKEFGHIVHKRQMMSLANSYSMQDIDDWFNRVSKTLEGEKFQIVGELKYDGLSISLTYVGGRLQKAVTRGDGIQGDDVTANVKTIRSIPLCLAPGDWPEEFEIRGEIVMPWNVFEELNHERANNAELPFANPRNAASGSLKMQDPRIVAGRRLDAIFYYLLSDNLPAGNHYDCMMAARRWGFKVSPEMRLLDSIGQVDAFARHWDTARRELPVATDGLVFKVNSLRQQLNLGSTAKSPRWAMAYKFNPENVCTRLRFVSFETGRMGIVTPVANLEPVLISGTTVKRASLHNDDIIRQLDIHEHDWLYVEKGGEIIPKITGVDISRRQPGTDPIKFVDKCPECATSLVRASGEAAWICPNRYGCRPQITGRIEHFCARRMMNIDGIGEETAQQLYDNCLVRDIADLYDLTSESLSRLEGLGEKSAARIINGIRDSLNIPFERVIYALSIPNVGETTAKRLAKAVGSMERMMEMTVEQLTDIPDVGPIIAGCIYDFLREPANAEIISRLAAAGVKMRIQDDAGSGSGNALEGKTIVISGTFSVYSRDQYKEMIERNGGKNSSSISKKTSFVLAGENMGPSKLEKCRSLGIPVIDEDTFLGML